MFLSDNNTFKVRVNIETTGDICIVFGLRKEQEVSELKVMIEEVIGIPSELQLLYYLDECALVDGNELKYYHILPDAKLKARVWKANKRLIIASSTGDWEAVERELSVYFAHPEELSTQRDKPFLSLCIACFYGKERIVEKLLQKGVNPRRSLLSGKHPLGITTLRGHVKCVEVLLERKVRPYEWNHERSSLSNWEIQDRIKATFQRIEKHSLKTSKTFRYSRLTNSQKYDSQLSTWYTGEYGQIYLCEILDCSTRRRKYEDPKPIFAP